MCLRAQASPDHPDLATALLTRLKGLAAHGAAGLNAMAISVRPRAYLQQGSLMSGMPARERLMFDCNH
jgi:hypothetical protein